VKNLTAGSDRPSSDEQAILSICTPCRVLGFESIWGAVLEGPISKPRSSWPSARQQKRFGSRSAKLKKLLLRYYPPGIILEYEDHTGAFQQSNLDLLNLDVETNVEVRPFPHPFAFFEYLSSK
jgi:hypothetical protein